MEIDIHKLKKTLQSVFSGSNEYKSLCKVSKKKIEIFQIKLLCHVFNSYRIRNIQLFDPVDTNGILDFLGEKLLEKEFTEEIGRKVFDILPLIVTKKFRSSQFNDNLHQRICVALAKLIRFSPEIQRLVSNSSLVIQIIVVTTRY